MNELPGWLKHGTVWLLLALGVFMAVQAWQARERATQFVAQGRTVEIRRAPDGHYHWPGRINGREVEFLVDTGATGTAIPQALARELGLPVQGRVQSRTPTAWPWATWWWATWRWTAASTPGACAWWRCPG